MTTLIARAAEFARQAHAGQRLPAGSAQWEQHVTSVAAILRFVGARDEMIAAGYLHGLIGRTSVSVEDIEREFGVDVSALVRGVAGAGSGNAIEFERALVEADRLASQAADVQTFALAGDLAALRGAHEATYEARRVLLDGIGRRVARLLRAHVYLRYEVRQELARWRHPGIASMRTLSVARRRAMIAIEEFESALSALTGNDPEVRPFVCDGSPLSCRVVVVGFHPTKAVPFWPFWRSRVGFDKRAWDAEYLRTRQAYSPTRLRMNRLAFALGPGVGCLESNIYAYPLPDAKSLPAGHLRTDILEFLLKAIRPEVGFFHGKEAAEFGAQMAKRFGFRLLTGEPLRRWSYEAVDELATNILGSLGVDARLGAAGDALQPAPAS